MSFDNSGALLEGIRISTGNNPFTFPPRSYVSDPSTFNSITARAEYVVLADSSDPSILAMEIADPALRFIWSRNQSTVSRFDYDGYDRRWLTMPGGPPDVVGIMSNDPRLVVPVPDLSVTSAPFSIYVGSPLRTVTFTVRVVPDSNSFTTPPSGTVELSQFDGKLNFSPGDVGANAGQTVLSTRQSFFDRTRSKGLIGQLPVSASVSYALFLNPRPAANQSPRVRIGFHRYLTPIQVPNEASLGSPVAGTFTWSLDTGMLRFSTSDISANLDEDVYYDGVILGSFSLPRTSFPFSILKAFPNVAVTIPGFIGQTDPQLYVLFAEFPGSPRNYFTFTVFDSSVSSVGSPDPGTAYIDSATGHVIISQFDAIKYNGWSFFYLPAFAQIENGVTVQFYRSGVNGSGVSQTTDFSVFYAVDSQVIQDGIGQSPFVMLPTTPIVDSSLSYTVALGSGSSGTFMGELVDGTNSLKMGVGYLLDLDLHQLKFSNRKSVTITLEKSTSSIKLADAAISPHGFQVSQNGVPITPGVEFEFNASTGLLEFIEPVGEDDPRSRTSLLGNSSLPNKFSTLNPQFTAADFGSSVVFRSGPNSGVYTVVSVVDVTTVLLSPDLISAQSDTVDIYPVIETVADRFWTTLLPPFKKFSVSVAPSPSGQFIQIPNTQYDILATTGQVNLKTPALPGQSFLVSYISLDSPDEGVTVTPTNRSEKALFKIRQESAVTTPGSNVVTFNSQNHVVNTSNPIIVYVDGITQDPSTFTFVSPGTLILAVPASTSEVFVDYWVEDAPGGQTSFNLLHTPVDVDFPQIVAGQSTFVLNGDQTSFIMNGSPILVAGTEISIVKYSSYDSVNDQTNAIFLQTPTTSSSGFSIQVSGPITGDFLVPEIHSIDVFASGTNVLSINGDIPYYVAGMIIIVDTDPYLIQSVQFIASSYKTKLTTASSAKKNYIIPTVLRTTRPVLDSSSKFQTQKSAQLDFPFTLIRMGSVRAVLRRNVDYVVGDGGIISLNFSTQYGDQIYALYVARDPQPLGTQFTLNYAYAITPTSVGLVGQQLQSTYQLYAPDSFFYRVETFVSFQPEVVDLLKSGAQGNGSSGPNTSNQKGMKTKDFGSPSLYFDEQHLGNIDVEVQRLLKFYNDLINQYEDILSYLDGRVVGGTSSKFRYDGNMNNPPRNSYVEITNDIDDKILLYNIITLTGFFTFGETPVYSRMFEPNNLSRIFPTSKFVTAVLNSLVSSSNFGQPIGSLATTQITSVNQFTSTPANSLFTKVEGGTFITIPENGNTKLMVPPFATGQKVRVYRNNGVPDVSATVISVLGSSPSVIELDTPTTLVEGSLLQDTSDSNVALNHFYTPGRDLGVDNDSGQILNNTFSNPILAALQVPVVGNELIDSAITFSNSSTSPKRVPALDGSVLTDDGHRSSPSLKRINETDLLSRELDFIAQMGFGGVDVDLITVIGASRLVLVGQQFVFNDGLNAGDVKTVATIVSPTSFTVSDPFLYPDAVGSNFNIIIPNVVPLLFTLVNELRALKSNITSLPVPPAILGNADSELVSAANVIFGLGATQVRSGNGVISTPATLSDITHDFIALGVTTSSYLFVEDGPNTGLYKIGVVLQNSITVNPVSPYANFLVSTSLVQYSIVKPWPFVNSKEFDFVTTYLANTYNFWANTWTWAVDPSDSAKSARMVQIQARQSVIPTFIQSITGLLTKDDKLYDTRFLWIQQRTDRKNGILVQQSQASQRRVDNLAKLLADQQKLLIAGALID